MSSTDPMLLKAMATHRAGRIAEAREMYQRILRRRPRDPDALNFLGMLEYRSGKPALGIELLQKSVRSAPANPHAWQNLGNMLVQAGDTEGAAQAYERVTGLAPDMWQAWFSRGTCLRRLRRFEEAVECLKTAISLKPDHDAAYERLGLILYRAGKTRELAELYADWVKYNPDNPTARHMYAAAVGDAVPDRASDDYVRVTFDAGQAEEMALARAALESMIARMTAQRIDNRSAAELGRTVAHMAAATKGGEVDQLIALNEQFHDAIHQISGCRYLQRLLVGQRVYVHTARALILGDGHWFMPSWSSLLVIGYIVLMPMSIGNVAWFSIVGLLPANVAALSSILVPVLAMVSGAVVRDEPLGPLQWAAMACCATALSSIRTRLSRRPTNRARKAARSRRSSATRSSRRSARSRYGSVRLSSSGITETSPRLRSPPRWASAEGR